MAARQLSSLFLRAVARPVSARMDKTGSAIASALPFGKAWRESNMAWLGADEVNRAAFSKTLFGTPLMGVGVYVVGDTMVDSGFSFFESEVVSYAQKLGVKRVVLTHFHEDHSGNVKALQNAGCEVVAPRLTAKMMEEHLPIHPYRHITWSTPHFCTPDTIVDEGDEVKIGNYTAVAHSCPGHSHDQMAYFVEEKGWLFAGDAYVHAKVPVALVVEDYIKTLHSCKKLAALPGLGPLFCAHRPQPDAVEAFGKKTEYMDEYVSRVRALHQQGLSELEIAMKATSFSPFMWAYTLGTG